MDISIGELIKQEMDRQGITATQLAANAVSTIYTATVTTTWTGSAAPYSQNITVSGLLASDKPVIDIVPSSTYSTAKNQLIAWAELYRFVTAANKLTVYSHSKTTTAVPIQILCIRK